MKKGPSGLQLSTVGIEGIDTLVALAAQQGLVFYDAPVQALGNRLNWPSSSFWHQAQSHSEQPPRQPSTPLANGPCGCRASRRQQPSQACPEPLGLSLTHGLAESLALAKGMGVNPALLMDVVTGGPMDSGYFQAKAAAILADNYSASFTIANAVKDARLIVESAEHAGVRLDTAKAGLWRFERALEAGHGDKDMAASYLA